MVVRADAAVDPDAVVVEARHALVAHGAVVRAQRAQHAARPAHHVCGDLDAALEAVDERRERERVARERAGVRAHGAVEHVKERKLVRDVEHVVQRVPRRRGHDVHKVVPRRRRDERHRPVHERVRAHLPERGVDVLPPDVHRGREERHHEQPRQVREHRAQQRHREQHRVARRARAHAQRRAVGRLLRAREQVLGHVVVAVAPRQHARGLALVRVQPEVRAVLGQPPHAAQVPAQRRPVQRRAPLPVRLVHRRPVLHQVQRQHRLPLVGRPVQRCVSVVVCEVLQRRMVKNRHQ